MENSICEEICFPKRRISKKYFQTSVFFEEAYRIQYSVQWKRYKWGKLSVVRKTFSAKNRDKFFVFLAYTGVRQLLSG